MPLKSSRGSGSVYPSAIASRSAALTGRPCSMAVSRNPSVPDVHPSIRRTTSPVSMSLASMSMTGSPAPTVASSRMRTPRWAARARSASTSPRAAVIGFLLASARCIPAATPARSTGSVSSAVTSTSTGLERAWRPTAVTASSAVAAMPPGSEAIGVPAPLACAIAAS